MASSIAINLIYNPIPKDLSHVGPRD